MRECNAGDKHGLQTCLLGTECKVRMSETETLVNCTIVGIYSMDTILDGQALRFIIRKSDGSLLDCVGWNQIISVGSFAPKI